MNNGATDMARRSPKQPAMLSADTIQGDDVCSLDGEKLGTIQDIMVDLQHGNIRFAVLSTGGFMGMGDRLFAIPWSALTVDGPNKRFTLDVDPERLKNAPGFDKDNWPDWGDSNWSASVDSFYGTDRTNAR